MVLRGNLSSSNLFANKLYYINFIFFEKKIEKIGIWVAWLLRCYWKKRKNEAAKIGISYWIRFIDWHRVLVLLLNVRTKFDVLIKICVKCNRHFSSCLPLITVYKFSHYCTVFEDTIPLNSKYIFHTFKNKSQFCFVLFLTVMRTKLQKILETIITLNNAQRAKLDCLK